MIAKGLIALPLILVVIVGFCVADTLTMKDGSTHVGTLLSASATTISFKEGGRVHRYSRSNVDSLQFGESASTASRLGEREDSRGTELGRARRATLAANTEIAVLTNEMIDSKNAHVGQTFSADVAENVVDSAGGVIVPKGSAAELVLRDVSSGGAVSGSELALDLQSVKVGGRRYTVSTKEVEREGRSGLGANKRTAEMVGGGAVLGTLIGAIAGGGKGAAIGAAAGAATGAGVQVLTRGKSVQVPAETTLRFKLDQPLVLEAAY